MLGLTVVFFRLIFQWAMSASTEPDAGQHEADDCNPFALSTRDSEVFADALLNPSPVNDRLRDTIRRYREAFGA
jgi:hypothetical protein